MTSLAPPLAVIQQTPRGYAVWLRDHTGQPAVQLAEAASFHDAKQLARKAMTQRIYAIERITRAEVEASRG